LTTGGLLCGRVCQALFMAFLTSCNTGPCGRSDGSVSPIMCWWRRDPWSSLAPNDLLSVLTSLGQAPAPACALGACAAWSGPPLLIIGSPCAPVPRNELPTPAQNPCLAPWDLLALWYALAGHLCLEHCACRELPRLQEAPERDQSLPGERHHPNFPEARPALPTPGLIPWRQRALRLQADPAPRNLSSHRPPITIPGLGHPQFPAALATLGGCWREPGSRADVLGRLHVPPGKEFHHK